MTHSHQIIHYNGRDYVAFDQVRLAAGPFLSPGFHRVEQYAELPSENEFRHGIRYKTENGRQVPVTKVSAGQVCGHSMIYRDIFDGDIAFFQHSDFEYLEHGKIVVVEKLGDEEGFGAWSLKRLVVEKPRLFRRDEFGEEIDWEDPAVLVLRSYNPRINPWTLAPSGRYRIRGVFLRSQRGDEARFVDSDTIWCAGAGDEA